MNTKYTISIVTACYNEEENIDAVYIRVKTIFDQLPKYQYEHIFIDNASEDNTVKTLKKIALYDKNVKIIVNTRNFGHIRSPFYGLLQAKGDAIISLVADLQDPPELIPELIKKWEQGYKVVAAIKQSSNENFIMKHVRKLYYSLIFRISTSRQIKNFTGFGLYDARVIEILKSFSDPYPYFRGMVTEIGFEIAEIYYHQPKRYKGFTKNNFFTLYDMSLLALTNYSKLPLRIITFIGFIIALICLMISIFYAVYKLIYWNNFTVGLAPLLVGIFFFLGVQMFFLGIIGEYILSIHTRSMKRPLVVEKERVNF